MESKQTRRNYLLRYFLVSFKRSLSILLFVEVLLSPAVFAANKAPVTTPTSPAMEKRLANIERLLQSSGLLDMLQQIELLQQEIAKLRGEIEVNNHVIEQMKNRQRDLYTDIDRRLQSIETPATGNQSPTVKAPDTNPPLETLGQIETVTPPETQDQAQAETLALTLDETTIQTQPHTVSSTVSAGSTPNKALSEPESEPVKKTESDEVQIQAEYQQAFKLLKQSQYDQAIKAFDTFLKAHPKNRYSDNAQYWMAEALYVKRQYEDAIKEYNNLVTNYPDSQKVPHGLLKIGYSYQELGKPDEAKLWYTDVKQRFPGTTASRLANDRLKHINDS
ncbi:MAG: tol-pal system protein YbgF [Gammaproteobacteria bacterium]|nr:MAG: tol-pal system protein YbgF [Gammaproteobacteria bacterium]